MRHNEDGELTPLTFVESIDLRRDDHQHELAVVLLVVIVNALHAFSYKNRGAALRMQLLLRLRPEAGVVA